MGGGGGGVDGHEQGQLSTRLDDEKVVDGWLVVGGVGQFDLIR